MITESIDAFIRRRSCEKFVESRMASKKKTIRESSPDKAAGQEHVCTGNCPDCKCGIEHFKVQIVRTSEGSADVKPQYRITGDKFTSKMFPADQFTTKMTKLVPDFNADTGDTRVYELPLKDVESTFK